MSNREQEEQKAIRKAKNDYMKRWRRRNPDKVKANTDRYLNMPHEIVHLNRSK